MRILDEAAVRDGLPYGRLVAALEAAFREGVTAPLRHHHDLGDGAALLSMPAWNDRFTGVKLITVTPANAARGLATVQGLYTLFDGRTGAPLAAIDGTALTLRRTAAASALAARYLASPDARRLVLMGAGALAPHLARAHAAVRPIREVIVCNRSLDKAEAVARELRADGFDARVAEDRAEAVHAADVVSCATMSETPLVEGAWLKPGTHVDLVGAFLPRLRESDAAVLERGRVFVDTMEGALAEAGDVLLAIEEGRFRAEAIEGTLEDLCRGRVRGRGTASEITVFKSVGTALEDLAAASLLVDDA